LNELESNSGSAAGLVIELAGVTREYAGHGGVVKALDGASFAIRAGEWVAITGPSGSGKSTLVNLLGCLDRPTTGSLKIDGVETGGLSGKGLDRFRADKIGFIFQQFHLIPYLSAIENVMLAQYFHSMTDEGEARAALERVGLGARVAHLPSELSGGEQQRVCIARALINNPPILLADEPTGNLDAANQGIVATLLGELHRNGHTIVMVTHDPEMAGLAQRKIALNHGKVFCHPTESPMVKLRRRMTDVG
jgi:putative ABC transport system ATP-binding protein